jgi:DNA-binding MarR family transcriptional regulator
MLEENADAKAELDSIIETMVYLYTESRRLTKLAAREVGLTGPQLTVVKLLDTFGDLSLSSLSERIRAQNSTVTGIIDRMEREDLVLRERSTSDRRVVFIRLTEKGKRVARDIDVEPLAIFRTVLSSLSREDTTDLLRVLSKLGKRVRSLVREREQSLEQGK